MDSIQYVRYQPAWLYRHPTKMFGPRKFRTEDGASIWTFQASATNIPIYSIGIFMGFCRCCFFVVFLLFFFFVFFFFVLDNKYIPFSPTYLMGHIPQRYREDMSSSISAQQTLRSACASAQSHIRIRYTLGVKMQSGNQRKLWYQSFHWLPDYIL